MIKHVYPLVLITFILLILTSCDIGSVITGIEIGQFPDNIVYYVGESDSIDFTGGTIRGISADGSIGEWHINTEDSLYEIVDNVDFTVPGVYEVHIVPKSTHIKDRQIIRIPIQVIERS